MRNFKKIEEMRSADEIGKLGSFDGKSYFA